MEDTSESTKQKVQSTAGEKNVTPCFKVLKYDIQGLGVCMFLTQISLCSPGWHRAHYVELAGLNSQRSPTYDS